MLKYLKISDLINVQNLCAQDCAQTVVLRKNLIGVAILLKMQEFESPTSRAIFPLKSVPSGG
jgi:hypothetical protein